MPLALLTVIGILALLFYVMYLVKPKRVKFSARVLKLVELIVEADFTSEEGKPKTANEPMTLLPEGEPKAGPEPMQKALP